MTPLFTKLNLGMHREILVCNSPESFQSELDALSGVTVHRNAKQLAEVKFAIAFVQKLADVENAATSWLPKAAGDATVWLVYPKMSSKKYKCEFNRDTGWATVLAQGFDTVRAGAIDADWSALRFRREEFIKR